MKRQAGPVSFIVTCLIGWIALAIAAFLYARQIHIPAPVAIPIAAAFLLEYTFYLAPGFAAIRERFSEPLLLTLTAVLPYLTYSIPTGQFHWPLFAILLLLCATISYWFRVVENSELFFAAFLAAIILTKVFKTIYVSPIPRRLDILGHLMVIRLGATVILAHRRLPGINFGFIPTWRESLIGARWFLYFVPVGAALGWALGLFRFHGLPVWQTAGVFLGYFWVVALSEEFMFRGIVQQKLARAINPIAALVLASVSFGLVHLWFPRHPFPNWRMATLAGVAGLFYGKAYEEAGGIRASMVAHALVVTVWIVWLN